MEAPRLPPTGTLRFSRRRAIPDGAANIDELKQRVEDWDTDRMLMVEKGGEMPSDESRGMAYIGMLPPELNAHITVKIDHPEFATLNKRKAYVARYV